MIEHITKRLQSIELLPEAERVLQGMAAYDSQRAAVSHWGRVIPAVQGLLGGAPDVIAPFAAAWTLMYAATIRLDHLQDGDPVDDPLPVIDPGAQYNLVFSYYVLATGLLDLLSPDAIPASRILRMRQLWTNSMLRMAGGQQRDLNVHTAGYVEAPLDHYQEIAHAKTGAAYALAFGGTASLLSDDPELVETLIAVGELYGALIQYGDDLSDAETQGNATLTLPTALDRSHPAHWLKQSGHTPAAFGAYLYRYYTDQAALRLAGLPANLRKGILDLFAQTFELQSVEASDAL